MYFFFLERNPRGIFAAGGAYVPTQEKKKKNHGIFTAGGAFVPTQEKKKTNTNSMFAAGGALVLTQEKKQYWMQKFINKLISLEILAYFENKLHSHLCYFVLF